jgi:hypothetical protein
MSVNEKWKFSLLQKHRHPNVSTVGGHSFRRRIVSRRPTEDCGRRRQVYRMLGFRDTRGMHAWWLKRT